MNIDELKQKLNENNVSKDAYSILGSNSNISVLGGLLLEYSKMKQVWQINILERGIEYTYKEYKTEDEACKKFFFYLTSYFL